MVFGVGRESRYLGREKDGSGVTWPPVKLRSNARPVTRASRIQNCTEIDGGQNLVFESVRTFSAGFQNYL